MITFLLNSNIRQILEKYNSKAILYSFLIHVVKDSKNYYNHKENPKVLEAQDRVIELLGDLLLGKEVSKEELSAAYAASYAASNAAYAASSAASSAAYAASNAAYAASSAASSAAYAASSAAYAASSAASSAAYAASYAASSAAYATSSAASSAAKEREYKHYLIELVLKEHNVSTKVYSILYKDKSYG